MKHRMPSRLRVSLLFATGWMLVTGTGCARYVPSAPGPAAEAAAPDFALTDASGETVTLAALRSEGPVVVVFYRGHW